MFKTRTIDVGLKVYDFGNPKAISIMGKRLVTDGVISSKTDLDVDITKYQINSSI